MLTGVWLNKKGEKKLLGLQANRVTFYLDQKK